MPEQRVNFYKAVGGWLTMDIIALETAYRATLVATHPDAHVEKTPEELEAYERQFARATEAWSILSDRRKRAAYNKLLYVLGRECPTCKSAGFIKERIKNKAFKTAKTTQQVQCPDCEGAGYLLTSSTSPETQALNS